MLAIDWLNGCRTPLMDGRLSGAFVGLTLTTRPEQLYRAMLEATAFGLQTIVETLRDAGVPVRRFVASGGLPAKSPLLMQIYADVLDERIKLAESDQSVALGAAILGCLAAGPEATGYPGISQAIHAMARVREDLVYRPDLAGAAGVREDIRAVSKADDVRRNRRAGDAGYAAMERMKTSSRPDGDVASENGASVAAGCVASIREGRPCVCSSSRLKYRE